ncbi:MAG: acetyltransferase, partial [Pseudomonadota bacterium]
GDNLHRAAAQAAEPLQLSADQLAQLEELGTLLNYNGYGATVSDLFFAPDQLFLKLLPYPDPFDFIATDQTFVTLKEGFESDMSQAKAVNPAMATDDCAMFILPQASWSRRVGGVYGNELARENPDRAHALLSEIENDCFQVSVRAPLNRREGADELCRQFPSGGGRKAAAGINQLPRADIDNFQRAFESQFKS